MQMRCDFWCVPDDVGINIIFYLTSISTVSECADNEFACTEPNICRRQDGWCDGVEHCPDGSDEMDGCSK